MSILRHVRREQQLAKLVGQPVIHDRQRESVQWLPTVKHRDEAHAHSQRQDLAGFRKTVQIRLDLVHRLKLVAGEPVAADGSTVRFVVAIIEIIEIVEIVVRQTTVAVGYVARNLKLKELPRCVKHHIQGCRTAELLVDQYHALVDLGTGLEVVDEPVFHREASNAEN